MPTINVEENTLRAVLKLLQRTAQDIVIPASSKVGLVEGLDDIEKALTYVMAARDLCRLLKPKETCDRDLILQKIEVHIDKTHEGLIKRQVTSAANACGDALRIIGNYWTYYT